LKRGGAGRFEQEGGFLFPLASARRGFFRELDSAAAFSESCGRLLKFWKKEIKKGKKNEKTFDYFVGGIDFYFASIGEK
jgi:hypothetical protein